MRRNLQTMRTERTTDMMKGHKHGAREDIRLGFLNVNGLTTPKYLEMCEEVRGGIDLFVIMETFWRTNRQKDMEDWVLLEKRRERESKRGGGIMMIGKGQQELKEIQTEGEDILACEWRIRGTKIVLVGVYWDVREKRKNVECKKEIERILSEYRDEAVVIVGDMNAHLESLDGRKNVNTEVLEDLLTENALVCVNLTEKCEGNWR